MRYLFFILSLISLTTYGQKYNGSPYRQLPEKTISLNDFGAKGDGSTSDAVIIENVFRFASANGLRVTGYGTFNLNNDSIAGIDNLSLWSANLGSFRLVNGKYLEVKKSIKLENVAIDSFLNSTFPIFFYDTVKNSGGDVIYDGLPQGDFTIKIDNCLFSNSNSLFNVGGNLDVPKDSSRLINSHIRNSTFFKMKRSAFNLPFYHENFDISENNFTDFDYTNFRNVFIVGLDNVFKTAGSFGLSIKNNKVSRCYGAPFATTYYTFLVYSTGAIIEGNSLKEVSGPVYAAGWNNKIHNNTLVNDTAVTDFAYIVKGGTGETIPTAWATVSSNLGRGKILSGIYFDFRADNIKVLNNEIELDTNNTYVGDAALRILSQGINRIDISGNTLINKQTNSATQAINITSNDTIGFLSINKNIIESESGGIKFSTLRIKSANVSNNPYIYCALNHTMRSGETVATGNNWYYNKSGIWLISINTSSPFYFKNNNVKPNPNSTGAGISRIFDIATDAATDSSFYYFTGNEYDLSGATTCFYVENASYLRFKGEAVTKASATTSYFAWVRSAANMLDIEATDVSVPFGKTFINTSIGATGNTAKLKIYNSYLSGSVILFSSATQSDITKDSLIIKGGVVNSTAYGTGWVFQDVPGTAGSGDVSSNTTTSVTNEVALFSNTGGKTIKRATGTGYAYLTDGVLSVNAGTGAGIDTVKHDITLIGDGAATNLRVDTSLIATKSYVDLNGGGGGGSAYDLYLDPTYFTGGDAAGNPMTMVAPGGTGAVGIKENFVRVTGTTYNVLSTDVNIIFDGTSATTFTMPAFNSANHKRVLYIRNASSVDINLSVSAYYNNTTSKPTIAPTESLKLIIDDTNDKIWIVGQGY